MTPLTGKQGWIALLAAGSLLALAGLAAAGEGGLAVQEAESGLAKPGSTSSSKSGQGLMLINRAIANGRPKRGFHEPSSAEVSVPLSMSGHASAAGMDARGSAHLRYAKCRLAEGQGDAGNCQPATRGSSSRLY